ncbi:hypothetical protein D3C80_2050930 [compost metagenome]
MEGTAVAGRGGYDDHTAAIGREELVMPSFGTAPAKLKQFQYELIDVLVLAEVHNGSSVEVRRENNATEATAIARQATERKSQKWQLSV